MRSETEKDNDDDEDPRTDEKENNITRNYKTSGWLQQSMSIFKDFLIYYDNLDVHPFVQAVKKMQLFYFDHHIVLFKLDVSVPSIARQWIFQMAHDVKGSFGLVQPQDNDLYCIIKQNIVGGPSIIFTHDAEVQCTFIHNDPNRPVSQMWALLAACRELAFNYNTLPKLLLCFFT